MGLAPSVLLACGSGPTIVETVVTRDASSATDGTAQADGTASSDGMVALDSAAPPPPLRPPTFASVTPARAAWVPVESAVAISGELEPGTAAVDSVTVSKQVATLAGAHFDTSLTPRPGINLVSLRAEASDGGRAVDGRAFHAGPLRPAGDFVPSAVGVHWSPAFLDDNAPDKDDLAAVVEALLTDPAVLGALNTPFDTEYALVTPTHLAITTVALDIVPGDGVLIIDAELTGLDIEADVEGKGLASIVSGPATLHWDTVYAHLEVALAVEGGVASSSAQNVTVSGEGFVVTSAKLESFAVDYPTTAKAVTQVVEELVRTSVGDLFGATIAESLPKLLEQLTFARTFIEKTPITLELDLEAVGIAPHGMNLTFAARAFAPTPILPGAPGSLITPGTLPTGAYSDAPLSVVVDDDLINQALAALWQAGVATNLIVEGDGLSVIDPSALPPVFQPTQRITIDLALPPTLGARAPTAPASEPSPLDALPFEIAIGEASLTIDTGGDRRFGCILNARAALGLEITADGALRSLIDSRPKAVEVAVGCPNVPASYDPGNVAALWRLGVPSLLGTATADLTIPIPGIPLSAFVSSGALATAEIVIQNARFDAVGSDGSVGTGAFLRISGDAVYREPAAVP
jgi:hypothetical protein